VEESPSPVLTPEMRAAMGEASINGARSVDYVGAGTIEFLVDKHHNFYFMEMNTRIQVEHTVTEEAFGIDLVRQQIQVLGGHKLRKITPKPQFHAIECRINAEDPNHDFRPSPGKISTFHFPSGFGVRVDSHAYDGYHIPPYYDSLIAKIIVKSATRKEAINKMRGALEEFVIEGPKTTIPFHMKLMDDATFQSGHFDTKFIETFNFKD